MVRAWVFALALAAVTQDPQKLKDILKDKAPHPSWVYHDLAQGVAEAKKTGKPLVVVFR